MILHTMGVLTCKYYVSTWANTYRYCKLSSPVSIDTKPTDIYRIFEISEFGKKCKTLIQKINLQ